MRPTISIVFDGVTETVDHQLAQLLGPERYHRFQPTLGPARDDFDDVSARNLEMLTEQARELVARRSEDLDRLLEQLVG
jgi:hypothetical protein